MAKTAREKFEQEKARIAGNDYNQQDYDGISDDGVRESLLGFCDAMDPEVAHDEVPKVEQGRLVGRESLAHHTAKRYAMNLRCAHERGLNLLDADESTINGYMADLVTEPDRRRHDLVEWVGSIQRSSSQSWVSALRGFLRWATDPEPKTDRPAVGVEWPVDGLVMFEAEDSAPDGEQIPDGDDLDAMREACLESKNTRRDRAFVEAAAGSGQRAHCLVTLLVGHVHLDGDHPHVLLNPEIDGDGDKEAIKRAGRWRPIVSDPAPIREWIRHHPLRDPELREEAGAPEEFEDCYVFIGDPDHHNTDPADHWAADGARDMLNRRKADTAGLPGVTTVESNVNPHSWRHYAYTQSQGIPIEEQDRRKVFGWAPGSNMGEELYGHEKGKKAGQRFAEAFREHHGEPGSPSVAEQVVGDGAEQGLSPEQRSALVDEILRDEEAARELADSLGLYTQREADEMFSSIVSEVFEAVADHNDLDVPPGIEKAISEHFEADRRLRAAELGDPIE